MPKVDGKGQMSIKETTPGASVDKSPHGDTPGGESKKGSHIKMEGPNSAKK